jgi:hypothetical protein
MKRRAVILGALVLAIALVVAFAVPPVGLGASTTDPLAAPAAVDPQGGSPTDPPSVDAVVPDGGAGDLDAVAAEACVALAPQGGSCTQPPGPWQTRAPMPTARYGAGVASDGIYVYAAGGSNGATVSSQFVRYDPVADVWTSLAPLPTAVYAQLAVYAEGKIFSFGGVTASFVGTNITQIYDIAANTWSAGAPMPALRHLMGGGYDGGRVFAVGGYSTNVVGSEQNQTWQYTIATNTWVTKTNMPAALGGPGSGVVEGHLYVVGGRISGTVALTSTYAYDIAGNSWSSAAAMPTAVNLPGAAVYGGRIWAIGGGTPWLSGSQQVEAAIQSESRTQIYDPFTNSWAAGPAMNMARSFMGAATVRNKIVAVGGYSGAATAATEVATQSPLRILIAYADGGMAQKRLPAQLLMLPGVSHVDTFNAQAATPTVNQLLAYDVVLAFSNGLFANRVALGDALADYQDGGGVVIGSTFLWDHSPYGLEGRWMTGGYTPFAGPAVDHFSAMVRGAYSIGHPLMAGVTALSAFYRQHLTATLGASTIAYWNDGSPLIALKGRAVGISGYVGENPGNWGGDFAKIIVNAGYLLRRGNGPCVSFVCPGPTVRQGAITSSSPIQTGRLFREDPPSTCAGHSCPVVTGATITYHYEVQYFFNNSSSPQCVTVGLDASSCLGNWIFSAAYLDAYNPASLCAGYLGDIGSSPNPTKAYSFTVPAWQWYGIVVNEVTADAGCPVYTTTVSAALCPASPVNKAFLPLVLRN